MTRFRDDVRRFWRGDSGVRGALAARLQGSADVFDHERAAPVGVHQLHHRARWLHPAATGSATTTSTTRPTARTIATAATTTTAATGASRGRPTMRRSRRGASASGARCWRRCCSRTARRCCSAAMSSAVARAATTTPTARTRSSPGSTGHWPSRRVDRRTAATLSSRACIALRARALRCLRSDYFQHGLRRAAAAGARHRVVR